MNSTPRIIFRIFPQRHGWEFAIPAGKPSHKQALAYAKKMKDCWQKREWGFLEEIALVTGLSWRRTEIPCYIVAVEQSWSSSDPLLIPMGLSSKAKIESNCYNLEHELIHCLLLDNLNKEDLSGEDWIFDWHEQRYPVETPLCRIHILVHAIHACVHKGSIKQIQIAPPPAYKRSWEIIEKEGAESIVQAFRTSAATRIIESSIES